MASRNVPSQREFGESISKLLFRKIQKPTETETKPEEATSEHRFTSNTMKISDSDSDLGDFEISKSVGKHFVTLVVGKSKDRLLVDKWILCQHVPFFDRAFNSNFPEATTSVMELPEDKTHLIQTFILWLYAGAPPDWSPENWKPRFMSLLEMYLLGEKWILEDLQSAMYRLLYKHHEECEDFDACQEGWKLTQDSTIRFVMIARCHALLFRKPPGRNEGGIGTSAIKDRLGSDPEFLKEALLYRHYTFGRHLPDSLHDFQYWVSNYM